MTMREGISKLGFGLVVACVLVFLVLMAQFKSFVDPLIIMLAVPLAMAGVVVMLFVTGTNLNIQSLMGALMLIGVVVNNSILLVEFANLQLKEGEDSIRGGLCSCSHSCEANYYDLADLNCISSTFCFCAAPRK